MSETPIYTIGYGARSIEDFIATLLSNDIAYVIDVRSRPYSRYKPEFSRSELENALLASGVRYVFMGDTLGGLPADRSLYTDDKVDYGKVSQSADYLAGISRLMKASSQGLRVTVLCSEGRPEQCHRSHLIGVTLDKAGIGVAHIDEIGNILSQAEVMLRGQNFQQTLPGLESHRTTSRKRYESDTDDNS